MRNKLDFLLYGKLFKLPIIKQIYKLCSKIYYNNQFRKYNKNYINEFETKTLKHIWGVKSCDDISGSECNLHTMNDIDLTYLKNEKKYTLGIETLYMFREANGYIKYLEDCLKVFTEFMITNKYDTTKQLPLYEVFSNGLNMNTHFESIEDCYTMFKILVKGYISK